MNNQEIATLREYCTDFEKLLENTEDGNGTSLHDIKVSFNQVTKTIEENDLVGTTFGSDLMQKAEDCANVLSDLWLTIDTLNKSITSFCDAQEKNNMSSGTDAAISGTRIDATAQQSI